MATTSIIADGITELASSDFTLAAGESTTLSLRGSPGLSSRVLIQFKDSTGNYVDFGEINAQNSGCLQKTKTHASSSLMTAP